MLESLKKSLNRENRKKKRDALRRQLAALAPLLDVLAKTDDGIDPRIIEWLNAKIKIWKKEERFYSAASWIGGPQARFLLNYTGGDIDALLFVLRQWRDDATGAYDFDGLKLPPPMNAADGKMLPELFDSVIIYHLLDHFDAMTIFQALADTEGPYELHGVCLRENDVVFDCGANIGAFSALAALRGARVYAFEPSRYIRETYLSKTAALNGGATVCPYALSDSPGSLEFVVYHKNRNLGSSHIRQAEEKKTDGDEIEIVEAMRLDDFVEKQGLERVDFIKADIEGAERNMLLGAENILKKFAPRLSICTYHLPDDPKVLEDIILSAQPRYKIIHGPKKLYAYVD